MGRARDPERGGQRLAKNGHELIPFSFWDEPQTLQGERVGRRNIISFVCVWVCVCE